MSLVEQIDICINEMLEDMISPTGCLISADVLLKLRKEVGLLGKKVDGYWNFGFNGVRVITSSFARDEEVIFEDEKNGATFFKRLGLKRDNFVYKGSEKPPEQTNERLGRLIEVG